MISGLRPQPHGGALWWVRLPLLILSVLGTAGCSGDEVTVYPVFCDGFAKSKQCSSPQTLLRRRFIALIERQEVLEWYPGLIDVPNRLTVCAVRSSRNWMCTDAQRKRIISMENGNLSEEWEGAPVHADERYVSPVRWWMLALKADLR